MLVFVCLATGARAWAATDLGITQYTFGDPTARNSTRAFTVRATNFGSTTITDAVITITLSPDFTLVPASYPGICTPSPDQKTLTCAPASLAPGDLAIPYSAVATTVGANNTSARIDSVSAADPTPANDLLVKTATVRLGADLSATKTDSVGGSVPGGGTITYQITVTNNGPDATNAIRLTDNLPGADDFELASASGTNWACSAVGQVVTCNYTGAAVTGALPPITISGQATSGTTGSIINNAFASLTSATYVDPDGSASASATTNITEGTDLRANKTMPASVSIGKNANITLQIINNGPQAVTGAKITDVVSDNLTIVSASGCALSGPTNHIVTCTYNSELAVGDTRSYTVVVKGATLSGGTLTNTATVAVPSPFVDPVASNNSDSVTFQVLDDTADFSITKVKTPNPVAPGDTITSTIQVTNNGPTSASSTAAHPLYITDRLGPDEIFVSAATGNPAYTWTCNYAAPLLKCALNGTATIASAATRTLIVTTQASATASGTLTNTACTGETGAHDGVAPADPAADPKGTTPTDLNTSNDCVSTGSGATSTLADLSILKEVSVDGTTYVTSPSVLAIPGSADHFFIRLTATNSAASPSTAPTVNVKDTITNAGRITSAGSTTVTPITASKGTGSYSGGTISWTLTNLAPGDSETLVAQVNRPLAETTTSVGNPFINTATIASPDSADSNSANDSSQARYTIAGVADMRVNSKTISPNAQIGAVSTYTISARNYGTNSAQNVVVTDVIDPTRFELVGLPTVGQSSTNPAPATRTCTQDVPTGTITCQLLTVARNETVPMTQKIRPKYPFGGITVFTPPPSHTNTASVTTSTQEDTTNNTRTLAHDVTGPQYDLSVVVSDPPPSSDYDPGPFGGYLTYDVRVANIGQSRAHDVLVVDTPQPPSGYTMTFYDAVVNPSGVTALGAGATLYSTAGSGCAVNAGVLACRLDQVTPDANYLDPSTEAVFRIRFTMAGAVPTGSIAFQNAARVTAAEQPDLVTAAADTQLVNNSSFDNTTVLPSSDLEVVSKTRITASPVPSNTPIEYRIVIANNGISPTTQVRVTDHLPTGFVLATPAPSFTLDNPGGATAVTAMNCSSTPTPQDILCILDGDFPSDPGHAATVTIKLYVKAADPYSGPTLTDLSNTATISPGLSSGGVQLTADGNPANNSKSAVVQISAAAATASIAGTVFADADADNAVGPTEGLAGVAMALQKSDGTPVATTTTAADGSFSFTGLAGDTYQLIETQPGSHFDGRETAGSAGGAVNNAAFGAGAGTNTISTIVLGGGVAATGYLFQELPAASIAGTVFADADNDNAVDPGEGLAGATVTLTGTDGAGGAVGPQTATSDASGNFAFTGLPPGTYTLVESQPGGYFDARETAGSAGGSVNNAAFAAGAATNTIANITLAPGAATGYRFQELAPASVSGTVYRDLNNNGAIDPGETGFAPAAFPSTPHIRLTGTDYAGQAVDLTTTVGGGGGYSFSGFPPSDGAGYTVFELVQPAGAADGLDRNGPGAVLPGSAGRAAPEAIPLGPVGPGAALADRDFGEIAGVSLSGSIFLDANGNSRRDPGETTGLAGGVVTLTGTDDLGNSVNCSVTTASSGAYTFPNPADPSPACQQLRPGAYALSENPPAGFTHVGLFIGSAGGSAGAAAGANTPAPGVGSVAVGGIVLAPGAAAIDYDFAEQGQGLTGYVYVDRNGNGVRDAGEFGIPGVAITLSGTTLSGQDVCSMTACAATTDGSGTFAFANVPGSNAAGYALTEQAQSAAPLAAYGDGAEVAGSVGGAPRGVAGNDVITGIVLAGGELGVNYSFGERAGSLAGSVFVDANDDGVAQPGEMRLAGITITLSGSTTAGQDICAQRAALAPALACTDTTGADGAYSFGDLPAGDYSLLESQPVAYGDGREAAGTPAGTIDNTAFGAGPAANRIAGIALGAGVAGTGYDFGERAFSIGGRVFRDPERDGIDGGGEPGLAGVTIRLTRDGELVATATTSADGGYLFSGLTAGAYLVEEQQPAGYGSSSPNSVAATVGGAPVPPVVFGETVSTLAATVFFDANDDGVRQAGESGIAGVALTLTGVDAVGASVSRAAVTDASGNAVFADLLGGAYALGETQPAAYADGKDGAGSAGGTVGNDLISGIALAGGTDATGYAFGERGQALSGAVYLDANLNGVRDAGEAGIAGVAIALQRPDGAAVATTVTGVDGGYAFANVQLGDYVVVESQPSGYLDAAENPANRVAVTVAGSSPAPINFGERGTSLSGVVYLDTNLNARRDEGEPGIPGVVVTLQSAAGGALQTATTTADGSYRFTGLTTGDYVVLETQPPGYGEGPENGSDRATVTIGGIAPPTVNFGERAGSITGFVYNDSNFNGRRDASEPGIAGVALALDGTDAGGRAVSRAATSAADGSFLFSSLVGGAYRIVETQPGNFQDNQDAAGTAGGAVLPPPGDIISGIQLQAAQDATGYLFGERGPGAQLSGSVWFDEDHDGVRDPNEKGKAGWTVQLLLQGELIGSTITDANGGYAFTDLPPGSGYALYFREPTSAAAFGSARPNEQGIPAADGVMGPGNPGGAEFTSGQLKSITLMPGANVREQSLPLDPSGVIYDSVKRMVVPGATIRIDGPAGFDPATHLLGGIANHVQTVGADGIYQFLLVAGAPNGVYTLTVAPPSGSAFNPITPSQSIPPCAGTLVVGPTPAPLLVSTYDGAPPAAATTGCTTGGATTAYFLSFNLRAGFSADVVNNNVPLDPIQPDAIVVTKTTPMLNVTRGGLVPYTVTAHNRLGSTLPNIVVTDRLPAGFRYRAGSARMDGVPVTPVEQGRLLLFPARTFAPNQTRTIELILTVGAGVGEGEHVNQAYAVFGPTGTTVSNVAEAVVRIEPDADFDCSDILGKVFNDKNGNGYEDEGEPGLPGVRLATVAGDLITTDKDGRYHVTCPMIPREDRGSNFILKLDTRTLPTGYRLTSENPETVRLTRGKFAKLNFGAAILRVVRLDVRDTVFAGEQVASDYLPKVDQLIATLEGEPSVLRIAYAAHGEQPALIARRLAAIRALVERKWGEKPGRARLIVELEGGP